MGELPERLGRGLANRYRLERELGRGGMATVYLAADLKHERSVALKVLKPELATAIGVDRFLREVKTTAQLTHPHILPLHDSGEADGLLFYVMPYLEGESLRDRLTRQRQLSVEDALQISREVADALSYAHSHGVIHRDIKPENILLHSGHAVVADFGIARAIDQASGDQLTGALALGTPAYMSPEQAAGSRQLDGRSDLYALGCVLYEMLAGRPPFVGESIETLVQQHLTTPPPRITRLRPAVPPHVAATLERALAKTPAERFHPVALFAEALGARAPGDITPPSAPSTVPATRRVSLQRVAMVAIGALVVIAGAVTVGSWLRSRLTAPRYDRTAIAVLPFQNLSAAGPHTYFAGGLHEELLTQLAKVASLQVISRISVMEYATRERVVSRIAEELGVGTIVEGTVQVVGDRLRVNVQLIDATTDQHVWAERYDRTLDDAFAVQSDIAQRIVAAVGAALTGAEATAITAVPTPNGEAYRLYLQGEDYRRRARQTKQDLESAQRLYERALSLDSTFALAYASLSNVHGYLYWLGFDPYPSRARRQREAAEAAIRLAPDLPQAHWAMGMVHYWGERDFARALPELTAAAEALPGSAELREYVGFVHRRLGQWDQALAALHKASALDPRDAHLSYDLGGGTLLFLHRYEEAVGAYTRALELAPDFGAADLRRAWVFLLWEGQLDSLRAVLDRGPESYGSLGSAALWRARLALWERRADTLLAMLAPAAGIIFVTENRYEPSLLYAGWAHQVRREPAAAARAFEGALAQLDSALTELPGDYHLHLGRGLALAGLGRESEARQELAWLGASNAYRDPYAGRDFIAEVRTMVFAQLGLAQETVANLEPLLAGPSRTSAQTVRLDPRYDPVRADPRFQALLDRYTHHPSP